MNFWQRADENPTWIRKYGCALMSTLKKLDDILDITKAVNFTPEDWYNIFRDMNIITVSGMMNWQMLPAKFPIAIGVYLYNGKHRDVSFVTNDSIISVDSMDKIGYQSHYLSVEKVVDSEDVLAYDPWVDGVVSVMDEYGKVSIDDSIYTIINIEKVE